MCLSQLFGLALFGLGRRFSLILGAVTLLGCSSSSGNQATAGACQVNPPANINITLCASIVQSSDPNLNQCEACCTAGGYSVSSYINGSHCTCANPQNDADAGAAVCADQIADSNACSTCCINAGYMDTSWVGNLSCQCGNKHDATICKGTLTEPQPDVACDCCCLNNGYPSDVYMAIIAPTCNCISGL